MKIAVIGGGAAGFFAAIKCAEEHPRHSVFIFEKSNKFLSKVRVSGGGRCNVTHACFDNNSLIEFYPRGKNELRNAFSRFSTKDTVTWFESRGVKLKTETDGRMFPVTDNSATIINCLMDEVQKNSISIKLQYSLKEISKSVDEGFDLYFENGETLKFDRIIISAGGNPVGANYNWIEKLGHTIVPPVPSLFTFNIPGSPLKGLEGISSLLKIKLQGSKYETTGPVLITHWGLSGPAVLRLSAFAARWLNENKYNVNCFLNWFPELNENDVREKIYSLKKDHPNKKPGKISVNGLPARLWERLCDLSDIGAEEKFADVSKTKLNMLVHNCSNMILSIKGKTTFKEEFVTCGGVSLKEVNMQTMESKIVKGIYFAGEVLDIDGITGGFNFQSAWTTGFLAGQNAGG